MSDGTGRHGGLQRKWEKLYNTALQGEATEQMIRRRCMDTMRPSRYLAERTLCKALCKRSGDTQINKYDGRRLWM
jgi:hypothetical protein